MPSGDTVTSRHLAPFVAIVLTLVSAACSSPPPGSAPEAVPPQVAQPAGLENGALIRPVDAVSLADLPGYAPVNFGHHYVYAVSPDGRTLAAVTWPTGRDNAGGSLHFVDIATWTNRVAGVTFDTYVNGLVFSADSKALYWNKSTGTGGGHGLPRDSQLYRYKIDSGKVTVVARFSPSFQPVEMRLVRSGHRLAVYGIPFDVNNIAADAPHLLLVDMDSDRLLTNLRISGLVDGQKRVPVSGSDENPYREYVAGRAWDTQNERLYIVHPDVDRITVVDLAAGTILKQGSVSARVSLLDRFWNHLVLPVEAKLNPGAGYQTALSSDGTRLYLTGMRRGNNQAAEWRFASPRNAPWSEDRLYC